MSTNYIGAVKVGMFDNNLGKPFAENFDEGEEFVLQDAKIGPEISTDYGKTRVVFLKINDDKYSIIGRSIESQVENMEDGDLPARVKIIRVASKKGSRGMKVIWPADKAEPENRFTPAGKNPPVDEDIPF